jgi:hypothetical protein
MSDEQAAPGPEEMPSEEEINQMMYERLASVPVPMVLLQTMASFTDIAAIRLGLGPEGEVRENPAEAMLAINALRALMPLAESALGEQAASFKDALASLQQIFVEKAKAAGPPPEGAAGQPQAPPMPPPAPEPPKDSGLWVPPHMRNK